MHTDLMRLQLWIDIETLMVHKIAGTILVNQCRVMSGCTLAELIVKAVVADQLDTVVVIIFAALAGISACRIHIRSGRIL